MTEIPSSGGGAEKKPIFDTALKSLFVGSLAATSFMWGEHTQAEKTNASTSYDMTMAIAPCSDGPAIEHGDKLVVLSDGRCLQTNNGDSIDVFSQPTDQVTGPVAFVSTGLAIHGICRVIGSPAEGAEGDDANIWTFVRFDLEKGVTVIGRQTEGFVPSLAVHGDDILPYCQSPDEKNA